MFWYGNIAHDVIYVQYNNLGRCYQFGVGVEKDLEKAVHWYQRGAEHGNSDAQCNLGWCYKTGTGTVKDINETVKWYRKSADQGNMYAQCNLGLLYENGSGVEKNLERSREFYRKAAVQGYAEAKLNLISLNWAKDRIQLNCGLSNFMCHESETYPKNFAGYWSSEGKMVIALDSRGIYSSSEGLNWNQETLDDDIYRSHYGGYVGKGDVLLRSRFYNLRTTGTIKEEKYPDMLTDMCKSHSCAPLDYIEHDNKHIFLFDWDERSGSTYYRKSAIVYGKDIIVLDMVNITTPYFRHGLDRRTENSKVIYVRNNNDSSSFATKEIFSDNGYVPESIVAWGDKLLWSEAQYQSNHLTSNCRITTADNNYNRLHTCLQLTGSYCLFSAKSDLAIAFSPNVSSTSYYTNDGTTWQPLQWAIYDITYVYGIYWAMAYNNGTTYIIASYDGVTWKQLGSISNFWGHFVIGNKKLFAWDKMAFNAELSFFDEQ